MAATDLIFPALEITNSRYSGSVRLPDSIADNAGAVRVVRGARGRRPQELVDLPVLGSVPLTAHRLPPRRVQDPRAASLAGRGELRATVADSVLSDEEKVEGIGVSCRAVPLTDVVIESQEGERLRRVLPLGFAARFTATPRMGP